jgi:hypothetical protein
LNYYVIQSLKTVTSVNTLRSIYLETFTHIWDMLFFFGEVIQKVQKYLNCKRSLWD